MINLIDRYHKPDKLIYDTIIDAANSTGKTDFGYQRSPALVQAGRLITFWKAVASGIRRRVTLPERMTRLASHLGIEDDHYQNIPHRIARRKITEARRTKREIHKRDGEERAKWLDEEAKAKATENPTGPDWTVVKKQMIHAAHDRQMNRKLSGLFRRPHTPLDHILTPSGEWYYDPSADELYHFTDGLFRAHPRRGDRANMSFSTDSGLKTPPDDLRSVDVEILENELRCLTQQPTTPIAWETVTDPVEIESWLAKRNKCHLQQVWADGSPAVSHPLAAIFGTDDTNDEADSLLSGSYDIDSLDIPEYAKTWLRWFKRTDQEKELKDVSPEISPAAFAEAFKAVDEMTSSSPSGLHYTLWKAIAEKEYFCDYMAIMMSLPFMYGFSNKRWEFGIDCMLEKKAGVRKIHLMRIIGLLEADFNTALKIIFARRMMCNGEISGMTNSQWGGRANRSTC